MKDKLAEDLLAKVMEWKPEDFKDEIKLIQAMAKYKYDQYQQFSPGMKYTESLALWLYQFDIDERKIAFEFIKKHLIFISKSEIEYLMQIAYNEIIKPILLRRVAQSKDIPEYKIKKISELKEFKILKRKCLFLGLSDGAHLDFFRRTNNLNNEQVYSSYQITDKKLKEMKEKLGEDLIEIDSEIKTDDYTFDCVFLIDDFSGSSDTLLRKESKISIDEIPQNLKKEIDTYKWGGKLWYKEKEKELVFKGDMNKEDYEILKLESSDTSYQEKIHVLYKKTQENEEDNIIGKLSTIIKTIRETQYNNIISKNAEIVVILYVATQFALETLNKHIDKYKKDWWPSINCIPVQIIYDHYKASELRDESIEKILKDYYDENIMDEHLVKGGPNVIHGYNNCSLPLVLEHNTPNNSIYLLWASEGKTHPLFKRVSRHKGD